MHRVTDDEKRVLLVKPRRLLRFGVKIDDLPIVGVFATDSPHRPNPIAISIVKLLSVEGVIFFVLPD
jgi:tRNA (Thr-GGU) A37 N-methylase